MTISPVIPELVEIVPLPNGYRERPIVTTEENRPIVGLRCAFCDKYFLELSSESFIGVVQVQVSKSGEEAKRWGGGDLVWHCTRCRSLGRKVTLDGRKMVRLRVPEATVEDIRARIGNTMYSKVQGTQW